MLNSSGQHRSRSRETEADLSPGLKSRRLENLARLSSDLVDRVASVNSDVIGQLLTRWEQTAHEGIAIRARASEMETMIVKSKEDQVRAELATAATTRQLQHQVVLLDAMEAKLQNSASRAAETVVQQLETVLAPTLRRTTAQLEKERDINNAIAERVHLFLGNCLETLRLSSQRALDAEMQTVERGVAMARLKSSLSFEQTRTLRHSQEVEALLSILRTLAERSKGAQQAAEDLHRCKEHVRRLERHLDLNGIVAAIGADTLAEVAQQNGGEPSLTNGLAAAASPSTTHRPPAPPAALQRSAPHYFALRMLQHEDMTLSELVDAWMRQEARLCAADARYVELQESAKRLKEDAAVVHQQYLEERQRREITDRRVTEMVLERVERDRAQATQTEIARLRANYTKVVDDASQLAVSLQMTRAALEASEAEVGTLKAHVAQLETDAATDEVASTICALREHYESKVASMRADFVDAQTERQLALAMAESRGRDQQRVQEALLLSRDNNTEMATSLSGMLMRGPYRTCAEDDKAAKLECDESRTALLDMTNRVHSAVEQLESTHHEVAEDRHSALDAFATQLASLTASFESLSRLPGAEHARPQKTPDGSTCGDAIDGAALACSPASPSAQLREVQHEATNKLMKHVVEDALEFVAGHLHSTEDQRNCLVDASISDAEYVSFLADRLHTVTTDRDALRAELKRSYDLIEQNHLVVVEHALMHDVSVEDSLNAAEAAEQIESLRQHLEALQQSRDVALTEVRSARSDSGDVATQLSVAEREKALLATQVKHLTDVLHSSFARETALHQRTIDLHGRLEALAESQAHPSADAPLAEPQADPTAAFARLEEMAARVGEQLASCERLLAERSEAEQHAAASSVARTVKDLEEDLARCGLQKVSTLLYEALSGSKLLQTAVDTSTLQQRGQLAKSALSPLDLTPEMRTAELELRNKQLTDELALLKQHRVEYEQRLHSATEAIGKSEAQAKRLLDVSTQLLEHKNKLTQKVAALQAEVEQLRQPAPSSATTPPPMESAPTATEPIAPEGSAAVSDPLPPVEAGVSDAADTEMAVSGGEQPSPESATPTADPLPEEGEADEQGEHGEEEEPAPSSELSG